MQRSRESVAISTITTTITELCLISFAGLYGFILVSLKDQKNLKATMKTPGALEKTEAQY